MTINERITDLQDHYGRKLPDTQFKFYIEEFYRIDDRALSEAFTHCKRSERSFPTTHVLNGYLAKVEVHREVVKGYQRDRQIPDSKPNDPEYVKESFKLLRKAFSKELKGPALVAEMKMMETWPGRGWAGKALEYERWLESRK